MKFNGFKKKDRLLSKPAYTQVFRKGRFVKSNNRLIKLYYLENRLDSPRMGLAIAKKNNPKSSQRNRIKRHLREVFRLRKNEIYHHDLVVMSVNGKKYSGLEIAAAFSECLNRINDEKRVVTDH